MANNKGSIEDFEKSLDGLIDPEEIISIDFDSLDIASKSEAEKLINSISRIYLDEEFIKNNPNFCSRINADIESIRLNIRMRKADEIAHDILLKKITQNSGNASLYKALVEMQRTITGITTKIEDTIDKLSTFIKTYQREFNFDETSNLNDSDLNDENDDGDGTNSPHANVHRGSKAFIEEMNAEDGDD